jgi:MFS family permease
MQTIDPAIAKKLTTKAIWRIGLLAGFLGLVAFTDRISIAYAGPMGMNKDLGLTPTNFGFAVGMFTIGYVLFEIPTSGLMAKVGVRRWIMRILLIWGTLQCLIAFVPNAPVLYVGRFLLGVAEAGFTPAIYFFISTWFIRAYRPLAFTLYAAIIGMSSVVGPIVATTIVQTGNALPFASTFQGWRLLLLVLGILALLSTILASRGLVTRPGDAKWLSAEESRQYEEMLRADVTDANVPHMRMSQILRDWRVWVMGFGFFAINYASYTITIWTPTIVLDFQKTFGTTFNVYQSSLIVGIPTLVGIACGFGIALLARRTGQSGWLLSSAAIVGAIGCIATTVANNPTFMIIALCLVAISGLGGSGLVMPMVTRAFAGAGAFTAIAVVNSMGASASFFSPIITGALIDATGNTNAGFYLISVLLLVGAVLAQFMHHQAQKHELSTPKLDLKSETQRLRQEAAENDLVN